MGMIALAALMFAVTIAFIRFCERV